ncbi:MULTISPECIES: hypothetical protein [Sphingomonas]|jgi:hypothetical protein|uniref:hypothetical protein n=1 Tax=Sphingomonas TaxID=13687 RepID=UPI000832FB89|nr:MULTISPECIES: hypothetical protein [Sphingomonas]MBY0300975.1 hypothetical protein [Sphingomonas ginsenosidimutans]
MYKIVVDRTHTLIRLDVTGMLTAAVADQLAGDMIARVMEAQLESYVLIIDISRCPVQSQDIIGLIGGHLTKMKRARGVAIVTGSTLVRLQLRRIFDQPFTRFAATHAEALDWLLSAKEPAALSA